MKQYRLVCSEILVVSGAFSLLFGPQIYAFQLSPRLSCASSVRLQRKLFSSIGGNGKPPEGRDDNPWSDFLDPNKEESENLKKAREFLSENSLPISYDKMEDNSIYSKDGSNSDAEPPQPTDDEELSGGLSLLRGQGELLPGTPTQKQLENNPYMAVVTNLSPSELISKFTSTTPPRVQNAVKSTILGLIGGLPKMAFDTTTITSGQRLASLMFQLQMTGYMFKNAEYKLSLSQAIDDGDKGKFLLNGVENDNEEANPLQGKVRGKLRVKYVRKENSEASVVDDSTGGIEVDAEAYMSELRSEVEKLRDELTVARKTKEETIRKDLLLYIRTLPEKELRSLTSTMSEDVLVAMKGLVNAVLSGIGDGQIGPTTITEQSGEAMAQLCLWQLAIGYNLRSLEVREEMKKSLAGIPVKKADDLDEEGGIIDEPGSLQ
ncbi:hypothetical protein FisN_3Hh420 [Fistulifera solaris]|uniref:Uncharacterized protein n=1 Tax=Fistulifera solaris TaxID=1519565 RepID=A0A1Z5K891_FISSO|nr:hypothetical protein FisN_3Hh420 [Fistulifera solaris]|eukprot:GAX22372.1 hypothetical protein FisN_3Hh420 [Fistulifera solaris]